MRTRETDESEDVPYKVSYIGTGTPPVPPSEAVWVQGSVVQTRKKVITDVECPSFVELQKCGEFLPLNPLVISNTRCLVTPGKVDCELTEVNYPQKYWGKDARFVLGVNVNSLIPPVDEAILAAVTNSAAAKAANTGWDVLTFLGELRATVQTIRELTRAMTNARLQIALEARLFRKDPWKRFTSLWLAGRYGVRPIWYDFLAATEALEKLLKEHTFEWHKGKAYRKVPFSSHTDTGWLSSDENWEVRTVTHVTGERTYRGWSAAGVDWLGRATNGALSADVAVTAWELTRMSFVVDRFIDVGSYIGALSAQLRGLTLGTQQSVRTSATGYTYSEYRVRSGRGSGSWGRGRVDFDIQTYTRHPVELPPLPGLDLRIDFAFGVDLLALFLGGERKVQRLLQRR